MLGRGYFINQGILLDGTNDSENVYKDSEGNIVYSPLDPIYIDNNNQVFFDSQHGNAFLTMIDSKVYAEKVV